MRRLFSNVNERRWPSDKPMANEFEGYRLNDITYCIDPKTKDFFPVRVVKVGRRFSTWLPSMMISQWRSLLTSTWKGRIDDSCVQNYPIDRGLADSMNVLSTPNVSRARSCEYFHTTIGHTREMQSSSEMPPTQANGQCRLESSTNAGSNWHCNVNRAGHNNCIQRTRRLRHR